MTTENRRMLRSIALVHKEGSAQAAAFAREMDGWLRGKGVSVWTAEHSKDNEDVDNMPDVDLVLVLGGDGTIVAVARKLLTRGIPVAGVNFGRVGFLAEIAKDGWHDCLSDAVSDGFAVEKRLALEYSVVRNNEVIQSGRVVNDLVVNRGVVARLGTLKLSVNKKPFTSLRADGIIFSTPTGSTGYACSAGGPLIMPDLDVYLVAPICPFLNSFPPITLGAGNEISATVCDSGTNLYLTVDGQTSMPLECNDVLNVKGAPQGLLIARLGESTYFERLIKSGFIQDKSQPPP